MKGLLNKYFSCKLSKLVVFFVNITGKQILIGERIGEFMIINVTKPFFAI
jgi:hypothetical protein